MYAQAAELRCKRIDAQLTCSELFFPAMLLFNKVFEAQMNEWAGQTRWMVGALAG